MDKFDVFVAAILGAHLINLLIEFRRMGVYNKLIREDKP
jgi:hypothetical protein